MRAGWGLIVVLVTAWGCNEEIASHVPSVFSGPKRCDRCAGSGQVTESFESELPLRVTGCNSEGQPTGFLNLGAGRQLITVTVENEGDVGGQVTIALRGVHGTDPNARIDLGSETVWIEAHGTARHTFNWHNNMIQGVTQFRCIASSAPVVQQRTSICPVCGGAGVK